ncbi:hypothetical protein A2U01_0087992, partial [Trifolium medium]|nr:hypothetical protein [Trifolium medium]
KEASVRLKPEVAAHSSTRMEATTNCNHDDSNNDSGNNSEGNDGGGNTYDAELWSTVAMVTVISMVDNNLIGCGGI